MRHSVRIGTTALGLTLAALTGWATFGAAGCTATTSDTTDTGTTDDTGLPTQDTAGGTGSVKILASSLIDAAATDGHATAFGKGSTYADIDAHTIAYAYAKITLGSTVTEFPTAAQSPIGVDASGNLIDAQIDGVAAGTYTIDVTGYLRGLNGPGVADNNTDVVDRVPHMKTTCTVTVAGTSDVAVATCAPLSVADTAGDPYFAGIIFPSDMLPAGYCTGAHATDFDLWRAREPVGMTGTSPTVSIATSDCLGVVFAAANATPTNFTTDVDPTTKKTHWGTGIELKSVMTGCSTVTPCDIVYDGTQPLIWVNPASHPECVLNATSTGQSTCF